MRTAIETTLSNALSHAGAQLLRVPESRTVMRLAGKVAVITGGSTGMGLATAKRFVEEGMDYVFITGRRKDVLAAAVAEIGEKATGVPGDVANLNDIDRLYETVKRYGRKLDVIFANAGKGFPRMSVYSATKAAVRSFARTWTNELRGRRIRVNAISPGHIDTPILESLRQGDALAAMKEAFTKAVPLGRMGDSGEIAEVLAFLASDEASHVSGLELFVDGGVAQI